MLWNKFSILEGHLSPAKILWLLIILLAINCSCKRLVGYKPIEKLDKNEVEKICLNYQAADCIQADIGYVARVKMYFSDSVERKNMLQPLQVHYFTGGILQSSLINCYAPGIFHLNWNTENRFAFFPPKPHFKFKKEISIDVFEKLLAVKFVNQQDVILIFWSNILKRKSEDLIRLVKKQNHDFNKQPAMLLINLDALYLKNNF